MKVLGIHHGLGASACLLENGEIKYCIQEERLTNNKWYAGFPFKSIEKILSLSNLSIDELDYVAMASLKANYIDNFNPVESMKRQQRLSSRIMDLGAKTPLFLLYKKQLMKKRFNALKELGISKQRVSLC